MWCKGSYGTAWWYALQHLTLVSEIPAHPTASLHLRLKPPSCSVLKPPRPGASWPRCHKQHQQRAKCLKACEKGHIYICPFIYIGLGAGKSFQLEGGDHPPWFSYGCCNLWSWPSQQAVVGTSLAGLLSPPPGLPVLSLAHNAPPCDNWFENLCCFGFAWRKRVRSDEKLVRAKPHVQAGFKVGKRGGRAEQNNNKAQSVLKQQ